MRLRRAALALTSGCGGSGDASSSPALRIGPLAATRKACTSPDGAQAPERGYLAALESAVRFERAGSRLTLLNAKGQTAVTLERSG